MAPKKVSVFAEELKAMQAMATSSGVRVPDGQYIARQICELRKSDSGNLRVARTFVPTEGDHIGLQIWDGMNFNNEVGIQMLRRWVETMGYEWPEDDLTQLEDVVNAINADAPICKIKVKAKGDFTNVRVLEVIGAGEAEAEAPVEEEVAAAPEPEVVSEVPSDMAEEDDLDSMDRKQLKAYIMADPDLIDAIKPNAKHTEDDMRNAIRAVRNAPAAEEDTPTEDNADLLTLCAEQGIDEVDDSKTREEIIEVMKDYELQLGDLSEENLELLESCDLSEIVKRPPPPAKKVAAPAKKAPVAPAKAPAKKK